MADEIGNQDNESYLFFIFYFNYLIFHTNCYFLKVVRFVIKFLAYYISLHLFVNMIFVHFNDFVSLVAF